MQEDIKPLSTENAVTENGIKVRPKEDVVIVGAGGKHLGTAEHTVHRMLAEKLVKSGQATYKDSESAPKKKKGDKD